LVSLDEIGIGHESYKIACFDTLTGLHQKLLYSSRQWCVNRLNLRNDSCGFRG
jgi:hypothetical protein